MSAPRSVASVAAVATVVATALLLGSTGAVAVTPADAGGAVASTPAAAQQSGSVPGPPDEFRACTNGSSDSVLACGYTPGPTDVAFETQTTDGDSVTVRAVSLEDGGFVAIHRHSFVDGEFRESLVGATGYLDAGLHENVTVEITGPIPESTVLYAVAYEDENDDGRLDFASADGVDRPYTNHYHPRTGHVPDESGDVIGEGAVVTVTA
jgi:hypothetical protein